jgi:hypothetical protein
VTTNAVGYDQDRDYPDDNRSPLPKPPLASGNYSVRVDMSQQFRGAPEMEVPVEVAGPLDDRKHKMVPVRTQPAE